MTRKGLTLEELDRRDEAYVRERVQQARLILERTDTDRIDQALIGVGSFRALAAVHAITTTVFGLSLILTAILGNVTTADSYRYLVVVPHWPWSVGAIMLATGILKTTAVIRFPHVSGWYPAAWWVGSVCWALYGSAFLVGAIQSRSTLGPQFLYLSLAVHASIVAATTRRLGQEGSGN